MFALSSASHSIPLASSCYTKRHTHTHAHTHARTHARKQASTHARTLARTHTCEVRYRAIEMTTLIIIIFEP